MWGVVWFCAGAFLLLYVALLIARMRLQDLRAQVDQLYLAAED